LTPQCKKDKRLEKKDIEVKIKKKIYLVIGMVILIVSSYTLLVATPVTINEAENVADFYLIVKEKSEEYSIDDMFVFENTDADTLSYIANLTPFGFIALSTDYEVDQVNADLYVSPTGSNDKCGLTIDEPLKTISYALVKIIPESTNPHKINLDNGIYSPSETGEIFPLYLRSYISLQGTDAYSTILDAEELSGIIYCRYDNDFSIENMTIKNGFSIEGAGIYCNSSSTNVTNLFISGNNANNGASIYCSNSSINLINITLNGNTAMYNGGSVYCAPSDPPFL